MILNKFSTHKRHASAGLDISIIYCRYVVINDLIQNPSTLCLTLKLLENLENRISTLQDIIQDGH